MISKPVFHPVLQTMVFIALMVLIKKLFPGAGFEAEWATGAAVSSFAIGIALGFLGGGLLERSSTTTDPLKPERSATLVTGGIYRYTRNPMYLGFVFILIACGFLLRNTVCFVAVPMYVASMTLFQIIPEERALTARFSDSYRLYRSTVRRWL